MISQEFQNKAFISVVSLVMSSIMSLKMSSKLYTEKEIGYKRVIEIRIRDLNKNKQKSFSLYTKKKAKGGYPKDYPPIPKIKIFLERDVKKLK